MKKNDETPCDRGKNNASSCQLACEQFSPRKKTEPRKESKEENEGEDLLRRIESLLR